jgi:4'-phosphopantetheinyl transferase
MDESGLKLIGDSSRAEVCSQSAGAAAERPPQYHRSPLPEEVCLESGQAHLWILELDLSAGARAELLAVLSADERKRADRFLFDHHRNRFIAGRGALRVLLSSYTGVDPDDLCFNYGPSGKPFLVSSPGEPDLHFNLAHSENLGLLAISRLPGLGVDLEQIRWLDDFDALVERFFSPRESSVFQPLPPEAKPEAFFNLWTRKEAWLKATGEGIGYSLNRVEVTFLPSEPARLLNLPDGQGSVQEWTLRELKPAAGYVGAVAVNATDLRINCCQWPLSQAAPEFQSDLRKCSNR